MSVTGRTEEAIASGGYDSFIKTGLVGLQLKATKTRLARQQRENTAEQQGSAAGAQVKADHLFIISSDHD